MTTAYTHSHVPTPSKLLALPLIAAVAASVICLPLGGWAALFAAALGLIFGAVVGLPAVLILIGQQRLSLRAFALAGAISASVPTAVLNFRLLLSGSDWAAAVRHARVNAFLLTFPAFLGVATAVIYWHLAVRPGTEMRTRWYFATATLFACCGVVAVFTLLFRNVGLD